MNALSYKVDQSLLSLWLIYLFACSRGHNLLLNSNEFLTQRTVRKEKQKHKAKTYTLKRPMGGGREMENKLAALVSQQGELYKRKIGSIRYEG